MPEEMVLKCLDDGIQYHNEKAELWKEMNVIAKECSRQTGISRNTLMWVKDYLHYRGRGWATHVLKNQKNQISSQTVYHQRFVILLTLLLILMLQVKKIY